MQILADIRFGLRLLMKSPGFTAAVIVLLALGIGANAAIFTVVSALLIRPLPYTTPERLVSIEVKNKTTNYGGTLTRYELLRDRSKTLKVAAWANDKGTGDYSLKPYRLEHPQQSFRGRMVFDDGEHRVELTRIGPGHTLGDAVAYLPKERILCADDVINLYFTRGVYAVFPITYVKDFSSGSAITPIP